MFKYVLNAVAAVDCVCALAAVRAGMMGGDDELVTLSDDYKTVFTPAIPSRKDNQLTPLPESDFQGFIDVEDVKKHVAELKQHPRFEDIIRQLREKRDELYQNCGKATPAQFHRDAWRSIAEYLRIYDTLTEPAATHTESDSLRATVDSVPIASPTQKVDSPRVGRVVGGLLPKFLWRKTKSASPLN